VPALALLLAGALLAPAARPLGAEELRVAVASNFLVAAREAADLFERDSGHRMVLISGSTGKHYAQIVHGAALDVFLAADRERPERLEAEGRAVRGSRFTYARGCLALWSPRPGFVDRGLAVVEEGDFRHLAIAEPRLAPYGEAAREVLERRGLWAAVEPRLVRGESIAQTYQFVASGNAELGFVACSQVLAPGAAPAGGPLRSGPGASGPVWSGSVWRVPEELHSPIEQQAVLLRDAEAPRAFLAFLRGPAGRAVVERHGYVAP
jgi:molybdate transport system substrate-binding protein